MPLRRNLFLLFTANTVSNFASGITVLAIPWYLVNLPESENGNLKIFLMMAGVTLVTLIWGLYAGTLIDRYNRKRIFQILQTVDFALIGLAGLYGKMTGEMPFGLIALVECVTICSWTLFYPNLYAFCQELVPPEKYKLVNSAIELQGQTTNFIGMLVGPMLMTGSLVFDWGFLSADYHFHRWQLYELFLLDGGTYLLSVSVISLIKYQPGAYISKSVGSVLNRLKTGFRYLTSNRPLVIFGIASYTIFFVLLVFIQSCLAIYIQGHLSYDFERGATVMGTFEMLYAIGAIVAGLVGVILAKWMARSNLIKQIIGLLLVATFLFCLLTFFKSLSAFYVAGFLVGIANAGTRILRITYLVRVVPNHMIGRVNTLFTAINALMRFSLFVLFMVPFFSAPENAPNIVYGTLIMATICLISAGFLVFSFSSFDQKAAYG